MVTATTGDSYYGAWWPGSSKDIQLTIQLADGPGVPSVPAFDDAPSS